MSRLNRADSIRAALRLLAALWAGGALTGAWAQPVEVREAPFERRDFTHVSNQPSAAEAFYEADLGAKVSGHVSELRVDVGTRVAAGQVLARIAVPELIQARNGAAAEVAALLSAYERTAALAERKSVTERALSEAKSRLDQAVAREAEATAELSYATIEAPFDGVITLRTIDPGDMVFEASSPKGGDQPLLRVAQLDKIRVKTYVPERDSVWVDVGDAAAVTFDALPGVAFAGEVARFSGALDPATRTMQVEIDLPNADGRIRPGFYGQARLTLEQRRGVLALPSAALRADAGRLYVFVLEGGAVRRVDVTPGLAAQGWTEIGSGLGGDERVVTGPPVLTDGAAVRLAAP